MRIEFVNRQRAPLDWDGSPWRIGSENDCELPLTESGVAPHHLTLRADSRGIVLEVTPGAGHVYVNARPVRERALLRHGDSLGVAQCQLRLCHEIPDDDEAKPSPKAIVASLRALAGPLSGRAWRIDSEGLSLGADEPLALALPNDAKTHLKLHWQGQALRLSATSSGECVVRVDGCPAEEVALRGGEQIAVGPHRFTIDLASEQATAPPPEPEAATDTDDAGPRAEVWWLLATAAALALLIALLLIRL